MAPRKFTIPACDRYNILFLTFLRRRRYENTRLQVSGNRTLRDEHFYWTERGKKKNCTGKRTCLYVPRGLTAKGS